MLKGYLGGFRVQGLGLGICRDHLGVFLRVRKLAGLARKGLRKYVISGL